MGTYSLCGGLRRHAVFADSQSECVLDPCFQFGAGDSQHRTAASQAEVQRGAVRCTLSARVRSEHSRRGLLMKLYLKSVTAALIFKENTVIFDRGRKFDLIWFKLRFPRTLMYLGNPPRRSGSATSSSQFCPLTAVILMHGLSTHFPPLSTSDSFQNVSIFLANVLSLYQLCNAAAAVGVCVTCITFYVQVCNRQGGEESTD